jgi:hypothetical protein
VRRDLQNYPSLRHITLDHHACCPPSQAGRIGHQHYEHSGIWPLASVFDYAESAVVTQKGYNGVAVLSLTSIETLSTALGVATIATLASLK